MTTDDEKELIAFQFGDEADSSEVLELMELLADTLVGLRGMLDAFVMGRTSLLKGQRTRDSLYCAPVHAAARSSRSCN